MWRRARDRGARAPKIEARPNARRDRWALGVGIGSLAALCLVFVLARDTTFLMPGKLVSAHGAINTCNSCHTKSGRGQLSWMQGLVAGDRRADSEACLSCHAMPDTAFNAHGAAADVLSRSTQRLARTVGGLHVPRAANAQSIAFPTEGLVARGLYCATCHQEHQGVEFDLKKMTEAQCRSCHVVKFDGFDGSHPQFETYPFRRRTRIIYDHAGHFGKHFSETAKKDAAKSIPETCATCHQSSATTTSRSRGQSRPMMAVASFEKTCASCHESQITGKDRVSGPKGVPFLSLPGLDLATLAAKKIAIGEWPAESEAVLTPFMKLMIARSERGRAAIEAVGPLDLQDLTAASDVELKAVADVVWEIKALLLGLIKGKASDVLADLRIGSGIKTNPALIADLTATIPRDLLVAVQRQWLPNLAQEMANRVSDGGGDPEQGGWITTTSASSAPVAGEAAGSDLSRAPSGGTQTASDNATSATENASASGGRRGKARSANAESGTAATSTGPPSSQTANQNDDLLFPTEEERRALKGRLKIATPAAATAGSGGATPAPTPNAGGTAITAIATATGSSEQRAESNAPAVAAREIEGGVDPETWADDGGWYRQDHGLFYRPTGHKDKLIHAWLVLTGPEAPRGGAGPATAIFDALTAKDAQGTCTKCHSVDERPGKGRVVNFAPLSLRDRKGRFTEFNHEPHFSIVGNQGCLACHELKVERPYLKSYEQGNPQNFIANFGDVKKEQCQSCHTASMARQDCSTCHAYHVNGVVTPIMKTKIPAQ